MVRKENTGETIMTLAELKSRVFGRGPDYPTARAKAANLITKFGIARPPVNPEKIAEDLGIRVVFAQFEPEVSKEVSGFFDFDSNTIFVNEDIPTSRKTFTIAHELGHALMHREYVASEGYQVLPRSNNHVDKPHEEVEADVFAACLLVPKPMLKEYRAVADAYELADMFAVSPEVVVHQMKFL